MMMCVCVCGCVCPNLRALIEPDSFAPSTGSVLCSSAKCYCHMTVITLMFRLQSIPNEEIKTFYIFAHLTPFFVCFKCKQSRTSSMLRYCGLLLQRGKDVNGGQFKVAAALNLEQPFLSF